MKLSFFIVFILFFLRVWGQENPPTDIKVEGVNDTLTSLATNPLKASLYSAVLPGLGQAYNKQYWKIPIVWAALGTGIGFVVYYNKRYQLYRNGFINSLNGDPTGFPDTYTSEILARAQDDQRRNRDFAIVITTLLYAMNIIDAIVAAHLSPMKDDKDLAILPSIFYNPINSTQQAGITLQFKF